MKLKVLQKPTAEQLVSWGSTTAAKVDINNYTIEAWLLIEIKTVGTHMIEVSTSNRVSFLNMNMRFNAFAPITDAAFLTFPPPAVDRVSEITLTAEKVSFVLFLLFYLTLK